MRARGTKFGPNIVLTLSVPRVALNVVNVGAPACTAPLIRAWPSGRYAPHRTPSNKGIRMTRRFGLVVALAIVSTLFAAPSASASNINGVHWSGSGVRTIIVVDKTQNTTWQLALDRAIVSWNSGTTNVRLVHRYGTGSCDTQGRDIEVCLGTSNFTNYAFSGGHYLGVAIKLRSDMHSFAEALSCHELGHAIGLSHRRSTDTSSCMTSSVQSTQTRPDAHDYATVLSQHSH